MIINEVSERKRVTRSRYYLLTETISDEREIYVQRYSSLQKAQKKKRNKATRNVWLAVIVVLISAENISLILIYRLLHV